MTVTTITIIIAVFAGGVIVGWFVRTGRALAETAAIKSVCQEQLAGQQAEQQRLLEQNRSLMEQVSEQPAASNEFRVQLEEFADALQEATQQRDELQQQIADVRRSLEDAVAERDQLIQEIDANDDLENSAVRGLKDRDEKIFRLSRELESWQSRLPPLIDKYRERNAAAERLERELDAARERIFELEVTRASRQPPIESDAMEAQGHDTAEPDRSIDADDEAMPEGLSRAWRQPLVVSAPMEAQDHDTAEPDTSIDADDQAMPEEASRAWQQPLAESAPMKAPDHDTADPGGSIDADDQTMPEEASRAWQQPLVESAHMKAPDHDTADPGGSIDADDQTMPEEASRAWQQLLVESAHMEAQDHETAEPGGSIDADDEAVAQRAAAAAATETAAGLRDAGEQKHKNELDPGGEETGSHDFAGNGADRDAFGGLRDNLKMISGIGPAIEKSLNEMGFFRFSQIAEMSEYDIDRISSRLHGFDGRIHRENWIGQAQNLNEQRVGQEY